MKSWFGWTLVALFVAGAADAYYVYRCVFCKRWLKPQEIESLFHRARISLRTNSP